MRAGSSAGKAPAFAAAPAAPAPSPALSQTRKCPCCGHRTLRPTREPGRSCRYRNTYLTLPTELPVPTCHRCRHMVLTYESVPELKATLEATFRAELVHRASAEITHLGQFHSQRRIEREVDLAQGYLSRLKGGDGVPRSMIHSPAGQPSENRARALPLRAAVHEGLLTQGSAAPRAAIAWPPGRFPNAEPSGRLS